VAGDAITPERIVGQAVRRIRLARGLTQAQLGAELAALGAASKWQSGVAALEAGRRRIGIDDLIALARIFDVPPQTLLAIRPHEKAPSVQVGEQTLARTEWYDAMRISKNDENSLRSASPYVTKTPTERRRKAHFDAVRATRIKLREDALRERRKFPGPTFVADRDLVIQLRLDELDTRVPLQLRRGEPYVARDAIEAQALAHQADEGKIRRVDRFEARRIRARKQSERGGKGNGERS
jgi:transcriptional regulator with XRE-family HTH domain